MTPEERATLYQSVFLHTPGGQRVLEDLTTKFYDNNLFAKDSDGGARETDRRLGGRDCVRFILMQVNKLLEDKTNDGSSDPSI